MANAVTFGGVVAIAVACASLVYADERLEVIAAKPARDINGVVNVAVGVKNNGTKTFKSVWIECGLYRGSDLVSAGSVAIGWLHPGERGYARVMVFQEVASKADKSECRASGVVADDAKEEGK
jgi:hypothetical protein